jgi:5'-phosphate synthase pdxT subunit
MTVGVLALQGDVSEHHEVLRGLRVASFDVRTPADLAGVDRLIIPGGESTAISLLLQSSGLFQEIIARHIKRTLPIFGTCAGAILLAKRIEGTNTPKSLALLNITIDRNAYGTQLDSFEERISVPVLGRKPLRVSFIRAPKITATGEGVEILAMHKKVPVLVRQGSILASACHPEVQCEIRLHEYFLKI